MIREAVAFLFIGLTPVVSVRADCLNQVIKKAWRSCSSGDDCVSVHAGCKSEAVNRKYQKRIHACAACRAAVYQETATCQEHVCTLLENEH